MKKVVPLFILIFIPIFFIVPAQIRAGANRVSPAGPNTTIAQASKEGSSGTKQRQNKPAGDKYTAAKRTPLNAGKSAPARPTLLAPPDAALLADWSVGLSWRGSPGRASYRLEVSKRPTFIPAILDAATAAKSYKSTATLAPGVYYWRVKALNAFKKSSAWSRIRRFTIADMAPSNTTAGHFINRGEASTDSAGVSLAIAAVSYAGVSAYYVAENPAPPGAKAPGWVAVMPTSSYSATVPYTLSSGDGTKTIYVWFKDAAGRMSAAASDSIILDTRPPEAMITSRPSITSDFAPASFGFTSSKAGATFECKLDSGGYSACSSPATYEGLAEGRHTFSVKAFNAARNIESSAASYTWAVTRPLINSTPSNFINHKGNTYLITKKAVTLSISAAAVTGEKIMAYFVSESPDVPDASDPGWKTFLPVKEYSGKIPFTLSDGNGTKRIYVWFKDTAGNISEVKSDKILYFSSRYLVILFLVLQAVFII